MIKILKPGTRQIVTCEKCGCEFSYEQDDVEMKCKLGNERYYVSCPMCAERILVGRA